MELHLWLIAFNLSAFFAGVFLLHQFIQKIQKKYAEENKDPFAGLIIRSGFILCYGILFYSWQGAVQNAQVILKTTLTGRDLIISLLSYSALFWLIGLCVMLILYGLIYLLMVLMTGGRKLWLEISQGDIGLAIFFLSIFLSVIMALFPMLVASYELCLPYPEVPMFR